MPVTVLLCEGTTDSPDARVLNKLLPGLCTVEPAGSKHGMDTRVLVRREVSPTATVMGLKDADFQPDRNAIDDQPQAWSKALPGNQVVRVGWSWARKEIENYLIDPEVVARALANRAPPPEKYIEALDRASAQISDYTAARTALSVTRVTLKQFPNLWGKRRGSDRHCYPERLSRSACRKQIKKIVEKQAEGAIPTAKKVVARFRALLPLYEAGGDRRTDYLYSSAGKDLLVQMDADLRALGFSNFGDFRERILLGIRDTADDIADWLPEWAALRSEIRDYNS
jgi:hypothetical protein